MSLFDNPPLHDFPDRAIRRILEDPRNLRDLIADVLPDLVDRFDFGHVEPVPRSFLLDDWRRRESDLLFRLPFLSGDELPPVLVCLLMEHQSEPDPWMPLRVLLYAVLFWQEEWKAWEAGHAPGEPPRLSPVVPIVFHTGPRPWQTDRELAELIGGPEPLRTFAPRWLPLFWNLGEQNTEELLEKAGEFLAALAVVRAEREDTEAFRSVFARAIQRIERLSDSEAVRWQDLLWFVLSWGLHRRPGVEQGILLEAAQSSQTNAQRREEIKAMSQKIQQTWEQEMLDRGQLRARREDLRALLEERFGPLPEPVIARIEATEDSDRLRTAIRRVLRLNALEELEL